MQQILKRLPASCFKGSMMGIERECLRVYQNSTISQQPHPIILGSPLTHPCITTDFSEALLELVTPPCNNSHDALNFLADTETFVQQQLSDEYLWASSMPCYIGNEEDIPIAYYGESRLGEMKTIYRRGLSHRYGKTMQVIAGIHFNYSFPENLMSELNRIESGRPGQKINSYIHTADYSNKKYMAMVRNLQRYGWLNLYLFGASPAICHSFIKSKSDSLKQFDRKTLYHPYATSLRMSNIGYTNNRTQHNIQVSYDSIEEYLRTLDIMINTPHPDYANISNASVNSREQLNSNILQIENEYYSTIRPKQVPLKHESHFNALQQRGIRYVELRSLDIDPFTATGVAQEQLDFLELFMQYGLLKNSPLIDEKEAICISENFNRVALEGRNPQLQILRDNTPILMQDWALQIMDEMQAIAEFMDQANDTLRYSQALGTQRKKIIDPQQTPSARILREMKQCQQSFTEFTMCKSIQNRNYFQARELPGERHQYYQTLSRKSHRQQQQMEARDLTREIDSQLVVNGQMSFIEKNMNANYPA